MGKSIKFNPEALQEKTPTPTEQKQNVHESTKGRDWKYQKASKANPKELSSKLKHGHFTKQHVWPLRDEGKKGHKI